MNEITKELLEALQKTIEALEQENPLGWAGALKNAHAAIAKAEAALAEPQADADGWIRWDGGDCPVSSGVRVDALLRNGKKIQEEPDWLFWSHGQLGGDIVAYRIVKESDK